MLFRVSTLALALFSGAAMAAPSLDVVLTQNQGMTKVSDGLYATKNGEDESYVATNQSGKDALLVIMKQSRITLEQAFARNGISRTEQLTLDQLDASIADLSIPSAKAQDQDAGSCGTTQIFTQATSTGGTTSSAHAYATNASGPVAATQNFAAASAGITIQQTNTVGAVPASAAASNPNVCAATGYAKVGCPAGTGGSIYSYAVSTRFGACSF